MKGYIMLEKPLFDPGFAPFVLPFYENIEAIIQLMTSIKNPKQRKFKFQMLQPQIIKLVENNISFYHGCIMWAKILKENMPDLEIINNPFADINLEDKNITQDDITAEIDYLINYFDRYKKDTKFYLSKELALPEKALEIATTYKDFLLLNKSFVNTKKTNDIILPANIDKVILNSNEDNKILIENSLTNKNLSILLP